MVQEFMILRCFSCATFQVHQVKKSKKWVCKVCGEKQSIKKVYAQGSGLDCRKHVQKLNMKQGEAQKGRDLAYSSDENRSLCNFSENTPIDDDDESSQATNCDNQEGFSKGESKWERFLEISSIDDNGSEDFDGFHVTTERDAFDKASSRGKRKSAWQHGKSTTGYQRKRSKNSASEDSISACDEHWVNSDNITGNTTSNMRHLSKKTGPRLQNFSPHNPVNNNLTAKQLNLNECQSYNNSLSACGDLQLNSQNSLYKCNIYFAKATRDPFPITKVTSSISGDQEKGTISSSKWTKFMSSSSSQTNLHENMMENNINPQSSFVSDRGLDNRKCNVSLTALSNYCQQDSESLHSQTRNSIKPVPDTTRHVNVEDSQSGSLLVQDLFKVDDDLDEEWWNSL